MKFRLAAFLFLFILSVCPRPALADPLDEPFLAAREAAWTGDRARLERLADELRGHELAAYVDYWRLQLDLKNDIDPATVMAFLADNEGDYLAEKVRGDWLRQVGKQQQWPVFDAEYPALAQPDQELACYALQSRLARCDRSAAGEATEPPCDPAALDEAMPLWLNLVEPPESCYPVLEALIINKRIMDGDVWARIRRQVEANRLTGARHSMNYLPPSQTPDARTALAVTDSPMPWLARTAPSESRMYRELAALAVARIARGDPRLAAERLERLDARLRAGEKEWAWGIVGWQAALRHMSEASGWFARAGDAPMSDEVAQWRVRAALRAQDWNGVRSAIAKLPPALAGQPDWIYWLGRAVRAEGRVEEAGALFARIAGQPNFYGNLADEELGRAVALPPRAAPPSAAELARAEANGSIRRALALFRLNLRTEGAREWNWALRGMSDRELLAASAVAERAGVYDRAIAAASRTRGEHDYTLRYPSPYAGQIRPAAREQLLDDAWVYGLVRQESRFVANARSSAGASGLMQLMPATARWVAGKIGLKNYHPGRVNDLEINVLLGASYLRMVMDRLDNHPVLASAGYNAGPGRARKWQADRPLEGAIYAETIPFNETRDYVKKVMSNAVYYSALFNGQPRPLADWLGVVGPRGETKTEELP
ncbi:MAG: lytic transglycosylase domain-containing protein [Candidatus Accumulibacter sp.]|jgi:soluble lytic murein transglycosylase|nr:lytic transglycosylase domain-containing protein [Accumulibacter sp.]